MAASGEVEADALAVYCVRLERVILLAADAIKAGDLGYATRVLHLFETKIRADIAAMESEYATKH
jgi:hypothetical protein